MANVIATLQVNNYVTDFGETISKLPFKFEENDNFADASSLTGITYPLRTNEINCSTNSLFSPRKLKILFEDGTSTELPVPTLSSIQAAATVAKGTANVACVSLIGERWSAVPPAKLGGAADLYSTETIEGAVKPPRTAYSFDYKLDADAFTISARKSFQTLPEDIFQAQLQCLENASTEGSLVCSFAGQLELRHFTGRRAKTGGGSIGRKIFVSKGVEAEIKQCGLDVAPKFNCLSYVGTSIGDVSLFYA